MKGASRIACTYFIFSILWIISSDKIIFMVSPQAESIVLYSTIKGIAFVTLTSLLIFYLSLKELNKRNKLIDRLNEELKVNKDLIAELHHRILNNLQVVISLFSNESEMTEFPPHIKSRIISRLFSLKSVFSIVYSKMNINRLNLFDALKEYATYRPEKICITNFNKSQNSILPIEKTVSIMIAIDILTYQFEEDETVIIEIVDNRTISVSGKKNSNMQPLSNKDKELLSMLLESSKCKVVNENKIATVTLGLD
ncbi:MAG: hypothetical protein JXK07_01305 [Spirochaetes bacterium]|nr:hypothetical protein [Spirochaetota bacterium]